MVKRYDAGLMRQSSEFDPRSRYHFNRVDVVALSGPAGRRFESAHPYGGVAQVVEQQANSRYSTTYPIYNLWSTMPRFSKRLLEEVNKLTEEDFKSVRLPSLKEEPDPVELYAKALGVNYNACLLYTSPSPRD